MLANFDTVVTNISRCQSINDKDITAADNGSVASPVIMSGRFRKQS